MVERIFPTAKAFFLRGRAIARALDRGLPIPPDIGDHVALLEPTLGATTAGTTVPLIRGQVGIIIKIRDTENVFVEFSDAADTVYAHASIPVAALLRLTFDKF